MSPLRKFLLVLTLVCSCGLLVEGVQAAETIARGDLFPEVALPTPSDPALRQYLGIEAGESFALSQVQADVVLVEVLNVHCPHCQMQAPSYNELYRLIVADPAIRGRIKLLALGAGNVPDEVESFRSGLEIPFPILADASFTVLRSLGVRATPFAIYVRQRGPGVPGVVADTHLGLNTDYEVLFAQLRKLADTDAASLGGSPAAKVAPDLPPVQEFPEAELQDRLRKVLPALGGPLSKIERLDLASGRRVYEAVVGDSSAPRRLFAEVISRASVCDICHDLHFFYVFDAAGQLLVFEPLVLTKYGNVKWNPADVEKMRRRVVGRYLTAPRTFDPKVDAVTSATITSAMIFDTLSQGKTLLDELRAGGRLSP